MQASCIICADAFHDLSSVLAVRCGHVFHCTCLTQWLARSKSCPICRLEIPNEQQLIVLHFNETDDNLSVNQLLDETTKLRDQLKLKSAENENLKKVAAREDINTSVLMFEKESLRVKIRHLEQEKITLIANTTAAYSMLLMYNDRVSELEAEQESSAAKLHKLEQDNGSLREEIERAKNTDLMEQSRISQLLSEQSYLRSRIYQLEQDKETLEENKNAHLKTEMNDVGSLHSEWRMPAVVSEQQSLRSLVQHLNKENGTPTEQIKAFSDFNFFN